MSSPSAAVANARKISQDVAKDVQENVTNNSRPSLSLMVPPKDPSLTPSIRISDQWNVLEKPGCHDVFSGTSCQGISADLHPGNVYFDSLVQSYKFDFSRSSSIQSSSIEKRIVDQVRSQKPPGLFLNQELTPTTIYFEMGTEEALEFTRQALLTALCEVAPPYLTPSKRSSETNEGSGPARTIADLASRTHRKVFSTSYFVAKKLKRFQTDSPSSPSRTFIPRFNSNVSLVDLCNSDDEESKNEEGKTPAIPVVHPKIHTCGLEEPLSKIMTFSTASNAAPSKEWPLKTNCDSSSKKDSPVENKTPSPSTTSPPVVTEDNKPRDINSTIYGEGKAANYDSDSAVASIGFSLKNQNNTGANYDSDSAVAPMGFSKRTKKSHHSFVLGSFSIERKRLLLDVLAPVTLSPEAMKTESWMSKDVSSRLVSKAFSQRFGSLSTAELVQLAKGKFLVPEGMVSVKQTLRAYRLSIAKAKESPIETKPSEASSTNTTEGSKEAIGLAKSPTTSEIGSITSFAWDGTLELVSKARSVEKPSGLNVVNVTPTEDEHLIEGDTESNARKDKDSSIDFKGSRKCESITKDQPASACGQNRSEGKNEIETKLNAIFDHNLSHKGTSESKDVSAVVKSNNHTTESLVETSEAKQDSEDQKEAEDSSNHKIVEYIGNELTANNREGHLPDFRETREILGEVMTNLIDMITKRFQQGQKQFPEEIETDNLIEGSGNGINNENLSETGHDDNEEGEEVKNRPMIIISAKQLLLLALPLICLAGIFRRLGLFDVSNSILEGCFRTFVQLHILGSLLSPIFKYGTRYPGLVGCYALFMIVLASYEASSRTKYTHEGQFNTIVQSLVLSVGWVAMWGFGAILKPRPIWNPRYLLPIVGMLLGNSINGISITLDTISSSLVENQSEVDLYLSFGANKYEAVSGIVAHAIQKGTMPSLNMMCVVGIVSIPGMMTGQILGGSSPMVAARYQAMIIFLIALSTLSTILVSSCLTVMSAFCSHQILRPERFVRNRKRGLARLILWAWGYVFGGRKDLIAVSTNGVSSGSLTDEELNKTMLSPMKGFDIRSLKRGSVVSNGEGINSLIQVSGLNRYFSVENGSDQCSDTDNRRMLFSDLSFLVNEGDLLLVSGPSGTGKSQLLRMMAGLSPLQEGNLWLQGRSWEDEYNGNNAVEWRRQVRYITQTKVQVPGTPWQFINKIQSFQSWKAAEERIKYDFMKHVFHHLRQWGMGRDSLDKDWSVLSGGESQRVLMAIALASRPKILLFDESTSALDHESKLAVETSIKDFVEDHEGGVLWVSHDEQQAERMASQK